MKRFVLSVAIAAAFAGSVVVTTGCPPKVEEKKDDTKKDDKKKKDEKKPEVWVDDEPGDNETEHPNPPKPTELDDARALAQLKADNAELQQQLATGKSNRMTGIINGHEHLYHVKDLEKYLPAAHAAGVATTVFVASSDFTLAGSGNKGEPGMSSNFEDVLLAAAKQYPNEVIPFCTLDPKDKEKLDRLKKHVAAGCKGLKLYSGHSNFYDGPLDASDMDVIYGYLEETQLPVLWHVHLGKYMDEFEKVVKKHPKLNLLVPHYGVTFWKPKDGSLNRLKTIMREHKNIYVDTSLGTRKILTEGMGAMEPAIDDFKAFFNEFQDQIVWGTDSVVTSHAEKTTTWFEKVIWATRDQLEKDSFATDLGAAYSNYYQKGRDGDGRTIGLKLPPAILQKVYVDNAKRWLKMK